MESVFGELSCCHGNLLHQNGGSIFVKQKIGVSYGTITLLFHDTVL